MTKMYPADLRGMMNSCQGIFSTLGSVVYLSLCGALNAHGPKLPFIGVAAVDVLIAILVVVLSFVGLFGEPESSKNEIRFDLLKDPVSELESENQMDSGYKFDQ